MSAEPQPTHSNARAVDADFSSLHWFEILAAGLISPLFVVGPLVVLQPLRRYYEASGTPHGVLTKLATSGALGGIFGLVVVTSLIAPFLLREALSPPLRRRLVHTAFVAALLGVVLFFYGVYAPILSAPQP